MSDSIYVFTRDVNGTSGREYRQCVTVFAGDERSARQIVRDMFAKFEQGRGGGSEVEQTYRFDQGGWKLDAIPLDRPRIVTWHVTS